MSWQNMSHATRVAPGQSKNQEINIFPILSRFGLGDYWVFNILVNTKYIKTSESQRRYYGQNNLAHAEHNMVETIYGKTPKKKKTSWVASAFSNSVQSLSAVHQSVMQCPTVHINLHYKVNCEPQKEFACQGHAGHQDVFWTGLLKNHWIIQQHTMHFHQVN